MDHTKELSEIKSTLRSLPRVRRKKASKGKSDGEKPKRNFFNPKRHEQYKSTNPYQHRVQSTPPQTKGAINAKRQKADRHINDDEQWLSNVPAVAAPFQRHHHRYYRDGINKRNDIKVRMYSRDARMNGRGY